MNFKSQWLAVILLTFMTPLQALENPNNQLPSRVKKYVSWSGNSVDGAANFQLPTAEKISEFRASGLGIVKLNERHEIELKDSVVEETVSTAYLYLTRSGIENSGNDSFWININDQHADILEAYVLQPDGQRIQVEAGTLQFNSDNTSGTFNDYFFVTVPHPQLRQGSISVLTYKLRTDRTLNPMPWSRILYPAGFSHTEKFQVRINWSNQSFKPLWETDYENLECEERALSLVCQTENPSPPFPTESDMPSAYDLLPTLVLGEPAEWETIATIMNELSSSALTGSKKIRELVDRLRAGAISQEEQLNRLTRFVTSEIRYVGIEHGKSGFTPKPTEKTLAQRYGDCKDKTMLFVDLAQRSGFEAYPVLTSTNRKSLSKLMIPSSSYFNHMIACVKLNADKEQCVDLTDSNASFTQLSSYIQGSIMLRAGSTNPKPELLPKDLYAWQVSINASNRFTEHGSIVEKLDRNYLTHWGTELRRNLVSRTRNELDQWLLDDYRNVYTDKATPTIQISGLDQQGSPLVISSNTQFDNVFDPKRFEEYTENDLWLRNMITNFSSKNSRYPYQFQGLSYNSEISFLNPERAIKNFGPEINYVSTWGKLNRWYSVDGSYLTVRTEVRLPQATIPPSQIEDFNRFLGLIYQENKIWFSFEKTSKQL